ncbi:ankyrin repeat domain-containing protein [Pluralibacter gergoviae]|uniref:ankyrin repeat domain-containing protein n=1 Tax=Pluralibacter gergoviae TaxID=61647 RepID=UPI000BFC386F|nr:ankyrin repeat domain-containing protein [Pluralibacter gergoviae]MCK1068564.1 ankyrin repeat domain-containing protein [Pluralibacter gergoviae]MCV7757062.1 ankyrin repeat domain-containing protein [Pluralibacter gergoviae]PHH48425.1 Inversin [Pluralibacter gergoviae]HDS1237135.1 ankyrin repeat domain-containing protein [Pluralibacter gergoviae]HDS1243100.1 ankyrin repeat domain-containing protein [Pluralibacter gergoviae]
MKSIILAAFILISAFGIQGCKKNMDYEPEDFFVGRQLEIAKAIYEGDEADLLKKLPLISTEELNKPAKAGMTLLFWAMTASLGDNATPQRLHIISDLVRAGADPLQPQPDGPGSPAELAMKSDKGVWIKAMLDGGLSPNAREKRHNEAIIFKSIWAKNTDSLKVLIDYGADINIRDSLENTVLISALDAHSYDHVILLLESGADSSIRGSSGWSMANQLQRYFDRGISDNDERKKLEKIKTLLIQHGGQWPPSPVKQ